MNYTYTIRNANKSDIPTLVAIIRNSFHDIALRFELTIDNCPKHPSNCTPQWIETALQKGVRYFILTCDATPCGCVALEQVRPELCYLERLAVLPDYRRRSLGKALVDHALIQASQSGAKRVEIGIIADHHELKNWYARLGFAETGQATFQHLPFEVRFMAKTLVNEARF
jgi:N-acetylglutamate synthase-like GNAT family acetyltransferase